MVPIARRNLFHDKIKLTTALVGVIFSVLLVTSLGGLYIGSNHHASGIIDNAGADLWIVSPGTKTVDLGEPISERRLYQAMATPGVLWAERLLMQFSQWRLPDGRQEVAALVGLESDTHLNLPWGMAVGKRASIRHDAGVLIDYRERYRFGSNGRPLQVGDRSELFGTRVRIAGFAKGVGSFTTIPYVFTTHKQAQQCSPILEGQTSYILVKAAPRVPVADLQRRLGARMRDMDVLTTEQFSQMSRRYWMFGTGIGAGIIFTAILGLIVGCVIVAQTIYAATVDRLGEYGTLKALGMENSELGFIIVRQAALIGFVGYVFGAIVTYFLSRKLPDLHLAIEIPLWLYGVMFAVTMGTCAAASLTSVFKVFRLPPAIVFRS